MEFFIDQDSAVSVVKQIQEQIKLAVAMGVLKTGDALPSIRDIERRTGINRGQIHRAYLVLKRSGLLSPSRGKGTVIATAAPSPHSMNTTCRQLNKNIVSEVRRLDISPTAFARYLSRYAQDFERKTPFISYVDLDKEIAEGRAAEISQLWQVPLVGLTPSELKSAAQSRSSLRKALANHLLGDHVRTMIPGGKIDVIPVKIRYTEQTIKELARIQPNASILVVLPSQALYSARFIVERLQKWVKSPGVEISTVSARTVSSFRKLLKNSRYGRILVTPGARSSVPHDLRRDPRVLLVRMQLDPVSLEAARIRAGVII